MYLLRRISEFRACARKWLFNGAVYLMRDNRLVLRRMIRGHRDEGAVHGLARER